MSTEYRLEMTFDEMVATKISLSNYLEYLTEKIAALKDTPQKSRFTQDDLTPSLCQRYEKSKAIAEDLLKKLDSTKTFIDKEATP